MNPSSPSASSSLPNLPAQANWRRLATRVGGKGASSGGGTLRLMRLFTEHLGRTRAQKLSRLLRDSHSMTFPPEIQVTINELAECPELERRQISRLLHRLYAELSRFVTGSNSSAAAAAHLRLKNAAVAASPSSSAAIAAALPENADTNVVANLALATSVSHARASRLLARANGCAATVMEYINSRRQRRAQFSAMQSAQSSSSSSQSVTVGSLMADASFSESDHDAHSAASSASELDSDDDADSDFEGMQDCATMSNDKDAFLASLDATFNDDAFMTVDSNGTDKLALAPESAFSGGSALVPVHGPRPSLLPAQDARALLAQHGNALPRRVVVTDPAAVCVRSRQALAAGFGAKEIAVSTVTRATAALTRTYSNINRVYYMQQQKQEPEPQPQPQQIMAQVDQSTIGVGSILHRRYTVVRALGAGSFGTVFECTDAIGGARVAVKMMNSPDAASDEIDVLRMLNARDPQQRFGVVRLLDSFVLPTGATCLVFELLSLNLYDIIRNTDHQGISLHLVRKFGRQLLQTLEFIRSAHLVQPAPDMPQPISDAFLKPFSGVVHCDVKPENILLCSTKKAQIRLIDFGSACLSSEHSAFTYVQSRFYRAPEVLLNLPYSHAVDVWSAACVLAELHTGRPLFPGRSEAEQLSLHAAVLGMLPPVHMIERSGGGRGMLYFKRTPSAYVLNTAVCPVVASAPLHVTLGVYSGGPGGRRASEKSGHTRADYEAFYDLLMRMLTYDPAQRLTPAQALAHPFFTAADDVVVQPAATCAAAAVQPADVVMHVHQDVQPYAMAATAGLSARSQAYLQSAAYARLAAKAACDAPLTPAMLPSSGVPSTLTSMSLGSAWPPIHSSKVGRAPAQPLAANSTVLPLPRQVPLGANTHRAKELVRARAVAETQRKAQRRAATTQAQWQQPVEQE